MTALDGNYMWADNYTADDDFDDTLALERITLKNADWEKEPSLDELESNPYLAEAQEALSRLYHHSSVRGAKKNVRRASEWY